MRSFAMPGFAAKLVAWQKRHGRHDLPWQRTRDPYAIWVSEIMLQQTRVAAVIPYYRRFMKRFPTIAALARAPLDEVLAHWSGLGYYSRARNLHRAARAVLAEHGGRFPRNFEAVTRLPGIGRSTAAAILAFAYGKRCAILDGNVKRVLTRCFGISGYPGEPRVERVLWDKAEALLPARGIAAYTQALMDLGATVCTRRNPDCAACPFHAGCVARRTGRTAELPAPRRRKPLPERTTMMLVLTHAGEVLLEKRPPTGIWGGMWSLPEIAPGEDAQRVCAARFGVATAPPAALPPLAHGFTHFRLTILPRRCEVTRGAARAGEPGQVWLPVEEALGAALPAPVKRILQAL